MSIKNYVKLANILKITLDIIFGGLVIGIVILVLWITGFSLVASQNDSLGTASVPVVLSANEDKHFEVTLSSKSEDPISAAFLDETEGVLRLETNSTLLVAISNTPKLIIAIGLAYCVFLLRTVVQAIRDGKPFTAENSNRIRRLGYSVLVLGFLAPSVEHIAAKEILRRLPTTVPQLFPGPSFDVGTILAALFILLLVYVWSYGLEIERDRELTI